MEKAALVFTTSSKWHEEKNQLGKKAMSSIFKDDADHSFNFLHHKQQKVTTAKAFVKPGTLPPAESTLTFQSFQTYSRITQ